MFIGLSFFFNANNGQCDRYLNITVNTPSRFAWQGNHGPFAFDQAQIFDIALDRCLPEYIEYEPAMYIQLNHIRSRRVPRGGMYATRKMRNITSSKCGYDINITKAELCDDNNEFNCVQGSEMYDLLINGDNLNMCQYKLDSNVTMTSITYGYYINQCNYAQNNPLFFKWEAECDNMYQLTFYEYNDALPTFDKSCLFQASIFANKTYADVDGINCSLNGCLVDYDQMDDLLMEDYECSSDCTTQSILSTDKSSGYVIIGKDWFIFGILFVALLNI